MRKTATSNLLTLSLLLLCLAAVDFGFADDGPEHRLRRDRPIEMGVSGGNANNSSFLSCCSGTLGAVLSTADGLAILSNNHIIGRNIDGTIGEDVNQPGLIERGCQILSNDFVGQVSGVVPIDFAGGDNVVDAAIALALPGVLRDDGFILDIGPPSSVPVEPAIGMSVKKSGRTTGLTFGTIVSINLTTNVGYQRPCGDVDGEARFVNQIGISPGGFIAGGDSGSLMVEDVENCPGPVGLLFAGSPALAVANTLRPVLDAFGGQFVGCPASEPAPVSKWEFTSDNPQVASVIEVQNKNRNLLDIPGVVGTGVGLSEDRKRAVLEIYLEGLTPELENILPKSLEGIEVKFRETGPFEAF